MYYVVLGQALSHLPRHKGFFVDQISHLSGIVDIRVLSMP